VAYLGFGKRGAWRAHRARAYNGGLGAKTPARSRGKDPGRGIRGAKAPWSWDTFCFWAFDRSRKFVHFLLKFAGKRQKAPFHIKSPVKNFHGRAKGGHRTMAPPKYATGPLRKLSPPGRLINSSKTSGLPGASVTVSDMPRSTNQGVIWWGVCRGFSPSLVFTFPLLIWN